MNKQYELFVGRLGKNPDLRYTMKSTPVCYLSVAVDKKDEEKPEWKRVVVWGKQAEICPLYLNKGSKIFVQGQNQIRRFETQDGLEKEYEECVAKIIGFTNV